MQEIIDGRRDELRASDYYSNTGLLLRLSPGLSLARAIYQASHQKREVEYACGHSAA